MVEYNHKIVRDKKRMRLKVKEEEKVYRMRSQSGVQRVVVVKEVGNGGRGLEEGK